MNEQRCSQTTFAAFDREKGIPELPLPAGEEFPLEAWYRTVYHTPVDELSVEDIAKALRQQIHPEHVVPIALRILKSDPQAGEMFDGEVLVSLKSIAYDYWLIHPEDGAAVGAVIEGLLQDSAIADDVRRDADEVLAKVKQTKG
jgi:hypothetical protein